MQAAHRIEHRPPREPGGLLVAAMYAFGFFGYSLFLLILASAGMIGDTRSFTMRYMTAFLVLSLFASVSVLRKKAQLPLGFVLLLLTFWGLYGLRILADGFLVPVPLRMPPWEFFARAFGMTAIPMVAFSGGIAPGHGKIALFGFGSLLFLFCVFASINYFQYIGLSYQTLSHTGVERSTLLNGQDISYAGAMLLLIVIWIAATASKGYGPPTFLAWLGALVCGLICLFLGGGRGAFIALGAGIGLITWFASGKSLKWRILLMFGLVLMIAILATTSVGQATMGRTTALTDQLRYATDDAGGGRVHIWKTAIRQFLDNWLSGAGLEVRGLDAYAHNVILDAYLSTGIVGGSILVVLLFNGVRAACRVMRHQPKMGWVALIFLHSACKSMFSGTVYAQAFWFSLIAVSAISQAGIREEPSAEA